MGSIRSGVCSVLRSSTDVSFVSLINLLLLTLHVTDGYISQAPTNEIDVAGSPMVLPCRTSQSRDDIQWTFIPYGGNTSHRITIVIGYCTSQYPDRYSTKSSATGECSLVISSLHANHSGQYTCQEEFGQASAELGVIVNEPKDFMNETGPLPEGRMISFNCFISYYGRFKLQLMLNTSDPEYGNRTVSSTPLLWPTPPLNVPYILDFKFGFSVRRPGVPTFTCTTTFKLNDKGVSSLGSSDPLYRYIWTSKTIEVLYAPRRQDMKISGISETPITQGRVMNCYAPANPPASYQWRDRTDQTSNVTDGPNITLSTVGHRSYLCRAWNNWGNDFTQVDIRVYEDTRPTDSAIYPTTSTTINQGVTSVSSSEMMSGTILAALLFQVWSFY